MSDASERLKPAILSRLQILDCEGESLALTRQQLMDANAVIDQLTAANARVAELERDNEHLAVRYRGEYEAMKDAIRAAIFTLEKALDE